MECEYTTLQESLISTDNNTHCIISSFVVSISELKLHTSARDLRGFQLAHSLFIPSVAKLSPLWMEGYIDGT
jgi:hypothetical protein